MAWCGGVARAFFFSLSLSSARFIFFHVRRARGRGHVRRTLRRANPPARCAATDAAPGGRRRGRRSGSPRNLDRSAGINVDSELAAARVRRHSGDSPRAALEPRGARRGAPNRRRRPRGAVGRATVGGVGRGGRTRCEAVPRVLDVAFSCSAPADGAPVAGDVRCRRRQSGSVAEGRARGAPGEDRPPSAARLLRGCPYSPVAKTDRTPRQAMAFNRAATPTTRSARPTGPRSPSRTRGDRGRAPSRRCRPWHLAPGGRVPSRRCPDAASRGAPRASRRRRAPGGP